MTTAQAAPSGRGAWLPITAGFFLTAVASWIWLSRTPNGPLRDELRHIQFWVLEAKFALVIATSWLGLRALIRALELRRNAIGRAVLTSMLALVLAMFVAPRTNRIYYDEHIYQNAGQNLSDLRLAQMCNDGTTEYGLLQCWRGEYNKEPYGYPYLLSVLYRIFGVHERIAFILNPLLVAGTVFAVFLIAISLTRDVIVAQFAALVTALLPELLRWGHTAAAEPAATFASALAMVAVTSFVAQPSTQALLWTMSATVLAVEFRPESILVVPLVLMVIVIFQPQELRRRRFWWTTLAAAVLLVPSVAHMVAVRTEAWGAVGARFSSAYLTPNLRTNGWFFLFDHRFPVAYTALAIAGAILWSSRRTVMAILVYFGLFWGVFLVFYAGSYDYGADDRFSLMSGPPLALAAGLGAQWVTHAVARTLKLPLMVAVTVLTALLAGQMLWYMPFVRARGEEAWAARADVSFAARATKQLPPNAIVLTQNPGMFHLWSQSAAQISLATGEPGYADAIARRYTGGVFFHWSFWCNVADPVQQAFCRQVLTRFPHTLIQEYRERDYRYAIYRLDLPAASGPGGR